MNPRDPSSSVPVTRPEATAPQDKRGQSRAGAPDKQPLMDLPPDTLRDKLQRWRRALKARWPYVRRRTLNLIVKREREWIDDVTLRSCASDVVPLVALKSFEASEATEVCLFVTHAVQPALKSFVIFHIEQMLAAGIQVVLVVNTDLPASDFQIPGTLVDRLQGAYVRANLGFDFAAWSHLWKITAALPNCTRLYLVNDSIVGPLDTAQFHDIVRRVRASRADIVGLTETSQPRPHLQSFFLVIQGLALRSTLFGQIFGNLLCLPTKDQVIATYETRLTGYFREAGLSCEALFVGPIAGGHSENDTIFRWAELIDVGFPYVKASMLAKYSDDPRMLDRVRPEFRSK